MAFSVKHDLGNFPVQIILGVLQAFLELVLYELGLVGPPLETLCYEVVGKSFELLVGQLHLVVLCVKQN